MLKKDYIIEGIIIIAGIICIISAIDFVAGWGKIGIHALEVNRSNKNYEKAAIETIEETIASLNIRGDQEVLVTIDLYTPGADETVADIVDEITVDNEGKYKKVIEHDVSEWYDSTKDATYAPFCKVGHEIKVISLSVMDKNGNVTTITP